MKQDTHIVELRNVSVQPLADSSHIMNVSDLTI